VPWSKPLATWTGWFDAAEAEAVMAKATQSRLSKVSVMGCEIN
jgi:hypothetical protein